MLSFCRKSKPGPSSFTRKKPHVNIFIHCQEITEERFPQRTFFRTNSSFSTAIPWRQRWPANISRHSKTRSLKHGFCLRWKMVSYSNNSSPSEKCPGVGFHKLPPASMEDEAAPSFVGVYKLPEDEQIRVCLIHFLPVEYERENETW